MITAVKRLMMVTAAKGIAAVLPENPYAWEFVLHLLMFIMFSRHLLFPISVFSYPSREDLR